MLSNWKKVDWGKLQLVTIVTPLSIYCVLGTYVASPAVRGATPYSLSSLTRVGLCIMAASPPSLVRARRGDQSISQKEEP